MIDDPFHKSLRMVSEHPEMAAHTLAGLSESLRLTLREITRLRAIIEKMDQHSPLADSTCDEPGITLSEAVMRQWPELAEPKEASE
jgi:hypothetical protein